MRLKHQSYVEATGQVRFSPLRAAAKVWDHAFDFLSQRWRPPATGSSTSPEPDSIS